jgi:hypothetical protein
MLDLGTFHDVLIFKYGLCQGQCKFTGLRNDLAVNEGEGGESSLGTVGCDAV